MVRPSKDAASKRSEKIVIPFTPRDANLIKQAAFMEGLDVAAYIRRVAVVAARQTKRLTEKRD